MALVASGRTTPCDAAADEHPRLVGLGEGVPLAGLGPQRGRGREYQTGVLLSEKRSCAFGSQGKRRGLVNGQVQYLANAEHCKRQASAPGPGRLN